MQIKSQLWPHYQWAQSRGVRWFNLALDDVQVMEGLRIAPREHCRLANRLFQRLREKDHEINRLPLMTCADYAYNPKAYDPGRSIGQAILRLGQTAEQRRLLKDLAEVNPGPLICKRSTCSFNSLTERFQELAAMPHSRFQAELYIKHVEELAARYGVN